MSKFFIFLICFVFLSLFAISQTGVRNNGAKMIVNTGAVMKITGSGADYTNTTSGGTDGRIDLDGKIELEGDWTNNASSGSVMINPNTDGSVIFNGASLQSISGSASTEFENITIDNTSGLSLSADINVRNILTLTNGLVTLNTSNLIIGNSGSLSGTFGSTKMFVTNSTGSLRKLINTSGSFTFPIGEVSGTAEYSPVDFDLTGQGGFSSAWVGARVINSKYTNNTSPSEYLNRYWTLSSSGITAPVYDAVFNYLQADVIGTEADIYSAEYNGATRSVFSTVNATSNLLSVTGLSTFADYTGVDGTLPTAVISTTESNPTNADPMPFTITFSEEVTGFAYTDIIIDNGSTASISTSDNIIFTFDVEPTLDGDVTIDVNASVAKDIAGNDNAAASTYTIEYDSTNPTVEITSVEPNPTNGSFNVSIYFNEVVTGFDVSDVTVGNGTKGTFTPNGNDQDWTLQIIPTSDGIVTVDINSGIANDAAGNGNDAADQYSILYDGTDPSVTLTSVESDPTNTSPFVLTIEFDEGVTDFELADLALVNCSAGNYIEVKTDTIFTVEITPITNGTVTVDLAAGKAHDYAGNSNTEATQFSIVYDETKPGVSISSAESNPTNASFTVSIHFDESVTGFVTGDIVVVNGTKGTFAGSGQDYTLVINPSTDGLVTVNIAADVAIDAAGNGNTAATQYSITYDGTSPGVEITSAETDPTNSSFSISIHFDESVTGFISDDVTVSNGTKGTFDGSGQDYTLVINPTSDGLVTVDIDADVAQDAATNGNTAATQYSITYDASNPTLVISSSETTLTNVNPIPITITFNEEVSGFILGDITVGNGAAGNFTTSDNITFTAEVTPTGNGLVTVDVSSDVAQDAATNGNTAATQFSITYDDISPGVEITSAETDPTNSSFSVSIHFDESVTGFISDDVSVSNGTKGTFAGSGQDYTLVINPASDGLVTVNIAADVAIDAAGNGNTIADAFSITYDASDPTVLSYNPADEATGVALAANLEINFDEVVIAGSGNIDLYETGVGIVESFDVTTDISGSGTSKITINPTSDLTSLTNYHVQIATTAFVDEAGNAYAGISNATTWNFTAVDASFPEITGLSPSHNSVDVLIGTNLEITFDEDVQANTGFITLYNSADVQIEQFDVTTDISILNNVITIDPTLDLDGETSYYVLIDYDAIRDFTNNAFAGILNTAEWNFTTEDVAVPTVDDLSPADEAVDVGISSNLEITFNENIVKGSGNIIITNATTVSQHESIDVTSGLVTISSNVATINPSIDFDGESDYYVEFASGVFEDESANDFGGISGSTTWNFTTEDIASPTVIISTAESSPTNTSPYEVTITFNEEVQNFTVGDLSVDNGTASGLNTSDNIIYTANITPIDDGTVSVNVPIGVAQDLAGNANEASNQLDIDYDGTSPSVNLSSTESSPTNSSPFTVKIQFTEKVTGFVIGDILATNGTPGNLQLVETDSVWTVDITPTGNGAVLVDVNAAVAADAAGNGNNAATQFSIDFDGTEPTVSISSSETSPTNASPIPITITFSEAVTGFTLPDIIVGKGSAGNLLTSDNITFTADITPTSSPVTVDINAGVAQDDAANGNTVATQFSIEYDSQSPTATITTSESSPTNSSPFEITITFSEVMTGFVAGDISVSNGTPSNLNTSDNKVFTADITPASENDVIFIVPAGVAQDAAGNGNLVSNQETVEYDSTSPTVAITTGQSGIIASDLEITITFNEEITDLLTGNITVSNGTVTSLSNTTPGTVWDATITPTADGTVTVDILADEITDIAGNGNISSNQITIEYDGSEPEITLVSPLNLATEILVSENLQITFDEIVTLNTGNVEIRYQSDNTLFESINVTTLEGNGTNTVTIDPSSNFDSETTYYVLIDAQAFIDDLGNGFAGISSTTEWVFTTEDITPPTLAGLSPINGTLDALVNTNLEITFSENVSKNVGSITIWNDDTDLEFEIIDVSSTLVNVVDNVATINPSLDLIGETNYYVIVGESTFQDLSPNQNNFGGITSNTTWTFATQDLAPPVVNTYSPGDGETGVSILSNLVLTFNENVVAGSGNITIYNSTLGANHEVIDINSANVTISNNVITIDPTLDFDGLSDYYILIDATAIDDAFGNSYAGIISTDTWNFTTLDVTSPYVMEYSPLDGATGLAPDVNLVLTFSENVFKNVGNITITNETTSSVHETISVTEANVVVSDNVVTIDPVTDFDDLTGYNVQIENGTFQDLEGNSYSGITDDQTWNFTVGDNTAPTISSFTPADNATDVALIPSLEINFNEVVSAVSGNIELYATTGDTHIESFDVTTDISGDGTSTITITPTSSLTGLTDYYILIDATAFEDGSGNSFAGISDKTTWNFTTLDNAIPVISSLSPVDGATNVTITSNLQITFSEEVVANSGLINIMDASGTYESIDVFTGPLTIASNVVTINPGFDFVGETDYYVLIDNGAFHDLSGNSFEGISDPTTWNFTTEDVTLPSVVITSSESGTVDGNFDVTITFSETVTGFTSEDLTLINGSIVSFTETTSGQVWTVTIEPVTNGDVTVDISAGVAQDASGNDNTISNHFSITYDDSGVGFEDQIPYEISIYSIGNRVIVDFTNEGNYQFDSGVIEVHNLLGQKIVETKIKDFVRFETKVDHVSQIYIVKVVIDGKDFTKNLYIE